MSEIISIHIGGAGAKVGVEYWKQLKQKTMPKTKQDNQQKFPYTQKFYYENIKGQKVPRSVFLDTDVRTKDFVSSQNLNFDKKLMIGDGISSRNLFSQGHYLSGAQLVQPFIENTRRQAEKCDLISGFIITSSPAGGAGGGLGTNVLQKLRQYYCATVVQDFKIMPGTTPVQKFTNLDPLSIYNMILSTHHAIEYTDIIYCLQNTAAERTISKRSNLHVDLNQINKYYATCLSEHVSAYLYPGRLNTNQRKRAVNLIPFPRLKYICGILNEPEKKNFIESSLMDINKLMYHDTPNDARIFSMNLNVCDQFTSENEINKIVQNWKTSTQNDFAQWIQNNLHLSIRSPHHSSISKQNNTSWTLLNGSNNIHWVRELSEQFMKLFRRKAFLYHYTADGMDEMQFTQAESNCNDLMSEYIPCPTYDMDEDYQEYNQEY